MKPLNPKNSGVIVNPNKGTPMWYQDRYQLAPAVNKKCAGEKLKNILPINSHN
jgi:hypothetical protein